jgi:phage shock protein E
MKRMKAAVAVLVAACLPLAAVIADSPASPAISQAEISERMAGSQPPPLIDVRTPAEYQAGHIPGAINIPLQEFERRFAELSVYRDGEVVLYCESGMRAVHGARWLESQGFQQLRFVDGHMSAWREAGLPTER